MAERLGQSSIAVLGEIQRVIGPCREWVDEKHNICGERASYVLWGKLFPPEALGPRCYDHAAAHVHHSGLGAGTTWALIHLGDLACAVADRVEADHA